MSQVELADVIGTETSIARDLQVNFERLVGGSSLSPDVALLIVVATATAAGDAGLAQWAKSELTKLDLRPEEIQEAEESAAIMGMLNMYYRFRHFIGDSAEYATTGLRMTSLAKPVLGKEKFEQLAFAVSVINGCEKCVASHEKALREIGVTPDRIHDIARLSAIVKGASQLAFVRAASDSRSRTP
jgi:alkyl hydroperoxide reductase subunit D